MTKEVPAKKLKNTSHSEEQRYQNNENSSWNELDDEEEKNVENFKYDNSDESQEIDKSKKQKPNPKKRKVIQVQQYQSALTKLRKVSLLYYNPFEVQKLNISLMPARKMLSDAFHKEKDYVQTLRNVGIKTRMRVRNKGHVKELLFNMLEYVESGKVPEYMKNNHQELLKKDDSEFDLFKKE